MSDFDPTQIPDAPDDEEDIPPLIGGFPEGYQFVGQQPITPYAPGYTPDPTITAPVPTQTTQTVTRTPLYRAGAENQLFGMSPTQVAGLQDGLASVGLISGSYQRGSVLDEKTMRGFGTLLGYSNALGLDYFDAMKYMQASGFSAGGGGGGGGRAAPTIQLTSSDDLKEVFRSAIFQTTGTYNSGINIDGMIDAYHSLERSYQTRAQSGGGGEVERAPNVQTFAAQQIREQDPEAVEAKTVADLGDSFFSILGPAV